MNTNEIGGIVVIVGMVILGLLALVLVLFAVYAAIAGAIVLIQPASDQGFIGFAAYVAMWVLLFPVMLVICIVIGGIRILAGTGLQWERISN